jgi:hypothetical protein
MLNRSSAVFACSLLASTSVFGCSAEPGGPEPSEEDGTTDEALLAGRRIPESEVADLVRQAGFPESVVGKMVCTAKWESSFYERASNRNRNGTIDRGLFQINSIHLGRTAHCPSGSEAIYDAEANARCAYSIYRIQGANAWYGYQAHRSECNAYHVRPPTQDDNNDDQPGCYSPTLHARVAEAACVQARSNSVWYQCHSGAWQRGGSDGTGPQGNCTSEHPLE